MTPSRIPLASMARLLALPALLVPLAVLLVPSLQAGDEASAVVHDLSFRPPEVGGWVVEYEEWERWDHPRYEMKGELTTKLVLAWKPGEGAPAGRNRAKAEYASVSYAGAGRKQGRDFRHDVLWTREKGFERGEKDEAVQRWIGKEIKAGVTLDFDTRGAADDGDC